jgi:hypothetical protein
MTRLGTDLARHLGVELGTNLAGSSGPPPVVEVPETLAGLVAWFDSRDPSYFALGGAGEMSAWMSRAGAVAGLAWLQGVASNQAKRVASEPRFNGMPAVLFDGVNDFIDISDANAMKFLHDGSGATRFEILFIDATGGANQQGEQSATNNVQVGVNVLFGSASLTSSIMNGSGTNLNVWPNSSQHARDVAHEQ